MVTFLIFLYVVSLFAGTWALLDGIEKAPVGYEDEMGFHIVAEYY